MTRSFKISLQNKKEHDLVYETEEEEEIEEGDEIEEK